MGWVFQSSRFSSVPTTARSVGLVAQVICCLIPSTAPGQSMPTQVVPSPPFATAPTAKPRSSIPPPSSFIRNDPVMLRARLATSTGPSPRQDATACAVRALGHCLAR